jgi:hypothetical protein
MIFNVIGPMVSLFIYMLHLFKPMYILHYMLGYFQLVSQCINVKPNEEIALGLVVPVDY